MRRHRRAAGDQGDARVERRARHRALRRAHQHRARDRRARQPGEGRVGPGACSTPTSCSACPRPPASRRSGSCHDQCNVRRSGERHCRGGFEAAGIASGIKPSGAPDLALVATVDHAPVTAAGVFTTNLVAAAPVQISRRHLADGRGRGGRPQLRQRQRGDRRRRAAPTRCACASSPPPASAAATARRARVLHRPHRHPDADGPGGVRDPQARRELRADDAGGTRRGRRDPHHRHRAQGDRAAAPTSRAASPRPSAAWPRARRCWRRRWRRCSRCSPPTPRSTPARSRSVLDAAVDRLVQRAPRRRLARAPTTPCSCSPTARSATSRSPAPGPACGVRRRRSPPRAPTSRTRWPPTPRAPPSSSRITVRGARSYAEARTAARAVAASQLVQCSLYGYDPYWGRVLSELGASGARFDPEQVEHRLPRRQVCRERRSPPPHDVDALARLMAAARHRDRLRPARRRTARRPCSSPTSRTRTSTRTWARRERHCRRAPTSTRRPRSSPRRCPTSGSSRARPS